MLEQYLVEEKVHNGVVELLQVVDFVIKIVAATDAIRSVCPTDVQAAIGGGARGEGRGIAAYAIKNVLPVVVLAMAC